MRATVSADGAELASLRNAQVNGLGLDPGPPGALPTMCCSTYVRVVVVAVAVVYSIQQRATPINAVSAMRPGQRAPTKACDGPQGQGALVLACLVTYIHALGCLLGAAS